MKNLKVVIIPLIPFPLVYVVQGFLSAQSSLLILAHVLGPSVASLCVTLYRETESVICIVPSVKHTDVFECV